MEENADSRIPSELIKFFANPGGHSLILRGDAGTGKTTLALQLLEELSPLNQSFYFSTRVSDILLLTQFPWLGEKLYGSSVEEVLRGQVPFQDGYGKGAEDQEFHFVRKEDGLNRLMDSFYGGSPEKPKGSEENDKDFTDVRRVYDAVTSALPHRTLVVIDSLDALSEKYGLSNAEFVKAMQKDLVEGYGSNVVFVLENNERVLDYLCDGVIILAYTEYNNRTIREFRINKLRGCEITQPKYLFTLNGGRVRCFGRTAMNSFPRGNWVTIPDNGEKVSFGLMDLDRLANGGMVKGSVVLIEVGDNIPANICSLLECSLIANFASMGRGSVWIPLKQTNAESARSQVKDFIHGSVFDRCVRMPEIISQVDKEHVRIPQLSSPGDSSSRYILPVEGSDAAADLAWDSISYSLKSAESPVLSMLGFDTLESIYGESVMEQMSGYIATMKRNRGLLVAMTSPSARSSRKLADLAAIRLRAERIAGTLVIYGEEPFTECNSVTIRGKEKGGPLALTPIV